VIRLLMTLVLAIAGMATIPADRARAQKADPANTLAIQLKGGQVLIKLRPDLAPKHVARVKQLAKEGFYDGTPFHRVIPGFMAQGGDPTGSGQGGSKLGDLPAEFSNIETFKRGTIGAARTSNPNSANSQFFICFGDGCAKAGLNGQYTIWGEVVEGMEHVDKIAAGEPPPAPDKIVKAQILADKK
jgi:peptidylprolyl isomerase